MPAVNDYKCSQCDLVLLKWGSGCYLYVVDRDGSRIICGHPGENCEVEGVLGWRAPIELIRERTGFNSVCVCLACLHQFDADFGEVDWSPYEHGITLYKPRPKHGRDKRVCPECKSNKVRTLTEMVGKSCPKCKTGVIEKIFRAKT